ncbi:MAG: hypothetical protein H3C35_03600 [Bacteroidetes bacterium]|nr:hypothetical protein [Bacteroidota bacterium]
MEEKQSTNNEEVIPPGKVKLKDGSIIDRADVCFKLEENPHDSTLLRDHKGTIYKRDEKGTLRRLTPKKKERIK